MNEEWDDFDGGIATEEYNERQNELVNKDYFLFVERTPAFNAAMTFLVITMIVAVLFGCYLMSTGQ